MSIQKFVVNLKVISLSLAVAENASYFVAWKLNQNSQQKTKSINGSSKILIFDEVLSAELDLQFQEDQAKSNTCSVLLYSLNIQNQSSRMVDMINISISDCVNQAKLSFQHQFPLKMKTGALLRLRMEITKRPRLVSGCISEDNSADEMAQLLFIRREVRSLCIQQNSFFQKLVTGLEQKVRSLQKQISSMYNREAQLSNQAKKLSSHHKDKNQREIQIEIELKDKLVSLRRSIRHEEIQYRRLSQLVQTVTNALVRDEQDGYGQDIQALKKKQTMSNSIIVNVLNELYQQITKQLNKEAQLEDAKKKLNSFQMFQFSKQEKHKEQLLQTQERLEELIQENKESESFAQQLKTHIVSLKKSQSEKSTELRVLRSKMCEVLESSKQVSLRNNCLEKQNMNLRQTLRLKVQELSGVQTLSRNLQIQFQEQQILNQQKIIRLSFQHARRQTDFNELRAKLSAASQLFWRALLDIALALQVQISASAKVEEASALILSRIADMHSKLKTAESVLLLKSDFSNRQMASLKQNSLLKKLEWNQEKMILQHQIKHLKGICEEKDLIIQHFEQALEKKEQRAELAKGESESKLSLACDQRLRLQVQNSRLRNFIEQILQRQIS